MNVIKNATIDGRNYVTSNLRTRIIVPTCLAIFIIIAFVVVQDISRSADHLGSTCSKNGFETRIDGLSESCRPSLTVECPNLNSTNTNFIYCHEIPGRTTWALNPKINSSSASLALVFAGCTQGLLVPDADAIPYSDQYPQLWSGVIYTHGISNSTWPKGILSGVNFKPFTDYIEATFSEAATIDSRWSHLLSIWHQSDNAANHAWDQGATLGQATKAGSEFATQLHAICMVPFSTVKAEALLENRTISQWVKLNAGDVLPPSPPLN
jgi:hypothetical protein